MTEQEIKEIKETLAKKTSNYLTALYGELIDTYKSINTEKRKK